MKKAKKAKKSTAPFTAKERKELGQDLEKQDYGVLVEAAIHRLRSGLHLETSEPRRAFVYMVCKDGIRDLRECLEVCIMGMVLSLLDVYVQGVYER